MKAHLLFLLMAISVVPGMGNEAPGYRPREVEIVVLSDEDAARLQMPPAFYFAPLATRKTRPIAFTVEELIPYVQKGKWQVVKLHGVDQRSEESYGMIYEAAAALTRARVTAVVGSMKGREWVYQRISDR